MSTSSLSTSDALAGMMMKGAVNCDKHIEQQNPVKQSEFESALCSKVFLDACLFQCLTKKHLLRPIYIYIYVVCALCVTCVNAIGHLHMEGGASWGHQRITWQLRCVVWALPFGINVECFRSIAT